MSLLTVTADVLINKILALLTYRDVLRSGRSCKMMLKSTSHEYLWRSIFQRDLSKIVIPPNYREAYKAYVIKIGEIIKETNPHYQTNAKVYQLIVSLGYEITIYRYDTIRTKCNVVLGYDESHYFECNYGNILNHAVRDNRSDLVEHLMNIYSSYNHPATLNKAIEEAVRFNRPKIVDLLAKRGAPLNHSLLEIVYREHHLEMFVVLTTKYQLPIDYIKLCKAAIDGNHLDLVKELLPNISGEINSLAKYAASEKKWQMVNYFLDIGGANDYTTLLYSSLRLAPFTLIRRLVESGADYTQVLQSPQQFRSDDLIMGYGDNIEYLLSLPPR
jgi:hypothetical protein